MNRKININGKTLLVALLTLGMFVSGVGSAYAVTTLDATAQFTAGVAGASELLDFNSGGSQIYDDWNLHIVTDDDLYIAAPGTTYVSGAMDLIGDLQIGNGNDAGTAETVTFGSTGGSSIYDNWNLHIVTDDALYLDAPTMTYVSGDMTVSGGELYVTPVASSASTTEGTIYYDSSDDNLYVYANGAFVDLTLGAGTAVSLDDGYNASAGASAIAVDNGSVTWTLTNASDMLVNINSATSEFKLQDGGVDAWAWDSDGLVDITDSSAGGDVFDIVRANASTGDVFDVNMGTSTGAGDVLDIAWGGASVGDAIAVNMDNNLAGGAFVVTDGSGVRTDALIDVTTDSTTGDIANFVITGATTGHGLNLDYSAVATGNGLDITYGTAAATGNAVDLNMGTNLAGQAIDINLTGVRTDDGINIDDDSTGNTPVLDMNISGVRTGNAIDVTYATAAATENAVDLNMGTNVAGDALNIGLTTSTTGNAVEIAYANTRTTGNALEIVDSGTATANAATVDITAATLTDVDVMTLTSATQTTGNTLQVASGASIFTTGSAVDISGSGAYATNADAGLLSVTATGAATDGYIAAVVANSATTLDAVSFVSGTAVTTGNVMEVNGNALTTGYGLEVNAAASVFTTGAALYVTGAGAYNTDAQGHLLDVTATGVALDGRIAQVVADSATTLDAVSFVSGAAVTTGNVMEINANALTTGFGLELEAGASVFTTGSALRIAGSGAYSQDADPALLEVVATGVADDGYIASVIANAATTVDAVSFVSGTGVTTGNVMEVNGNALTTGYGLEVNAGASTITTGAALYVAGSGAYNTNAQGHLLDVTATGIALDGRIAQVVADAATTVDAVSFVSGTGITTGNVMEVNANALTTGYGLEVNAAASTITTGAALYVAGSGAYNTNAEAQLLDVTATGIALDGRIAQVVADSATTLDAVSFVSGTGVTTGNVMEVNANALTTGFALEVAAGASVFAAGSAVQISGSGIYNTNDDAALLDVQATGAATDGYITAVFADAATTLDAVSYFSGNALTSGDLVRLENTGTSRTTGHMLAITDAVDGTVTTGSTVHVTQSAAADQMAVEIDTAGVAAADEGAGLDVGGTGAVVAGGSLVYIHNTAAAGGATAYALHIEAGGTNFEALHVDAGEALFDEQVTITAGGLTVTAGGITVTAGDVTLADGAMAAATETVASVAGPTAIDSNVIHLTGANTVTTITGGVDGQLLTIIFDAAAVLTDDDNNGADATNVDGTGNLTGADDTVAQFVYDGTSWYATATEVTNN